MENKYGKTELSIKGNLKKIKQLVGAALDIRMEMIIKVK